jgi:Zn-dependent protease with chaperone function
MRFNDELPDDRVNSSQQSPLRDAALIALGVISLCIVLVVAVAGAIDVAVPFIPPSIEARIFSLIDLEDFDEGFASGPEDGRPDPRAEYVQELVDGLARHWPELPFRLRTHLVEDESPNAFAIPGGTIMVTQGLLDSVRSETELAFVLGHEIGHFQQRDHLRGLGRGLALVFVGFGLDLGGARGASSLLQGAMGIADRHFDRDQESGADRIGLDLVWREYGDVSGATDFFAQVDELAPEAAGKPLPKDRLGERLEGYFSTHPLDEKRARALERLADDNGWERAGMPRALRLPPRLGAAEVEDAPYPPES